MIESKEGLESEAKRQDCFLCRPSAGLIVDVGVGGYALAGLGPLADGYTVVSTHGHLLGLAAATGKLLRAYSDYALQVAGTLERHFGSCFIVEHGNMAVCGISDEGRVHCFHPHFLLVPDARCSVAAFADYRWSAVHEFATLLDALQFAASRGQYVLAGPSGGPFKTYLPDGELPRQFARGLLAEQLGRDHLASWRDEPDLGWTIKNAILLRQLLQAP